MQEGDRLTLGSVDASQRHTRPPPHFSEAALVKALEQHGIGRPATYASILKTLQAGARLFAWSGQAAGPAPRHAGQLSHWGGCGGGSALCVLPPLNRAATCSLSAGAALSP